MKYCSREATKSNLFLPMGTAMPPPLWRTPAKPWISDETGVKS